MSGRRVNVYLPNEIYQRALQADLNLSGLLRKSIIAELAQKSAPDRKR